MKPRKSRYAPYTLSRFTAAGTHGLGVSISRLLPCFGFSRARPASEQYVRVLVVTAVYILQEIGWVSVIGEDNDRIAPFS